MYKRQEYGRLLHDSGVGVPRTMPYARHVWHVYAVRTQDRPGLLAALERQEIQSGIHYPIPIHLQPAWAELNHSRGDFPHAERAADEVLSLPMFCLLYTSRGRGWYRASSSWRCKMPRKVIAG